MATILINSVSPTTNPFVKQARKSHLPLLHSLPSNKNFPPNISQSGPVPIYTKDQPFDLPKWNGRNQLDEVLTYFEDMVGQGFKPNAYQANQLLSDLCKWNKSQKARRVIDLIISSRSTLDTRHCITLLTYLCKYNLVTSAATLIEKMEDNGYSTNISLYNILVKEFILKREFKLAWKFVHKLFQQGIMPTSQTYSILLEGVCLESGVDEAMRLYGYLNSNSHYLTLSSYNTLLIGFCEENRVDEAIRFFRTWRSLGIDPDYISYNILVKAFCLQGWWEQAEELLVEMKETGCSPTKHTYDMLVSVLAHHGRADDALLLIKEMIRKGFETDAITYNPVIKNLCKQRKVGDVVKCLNHMKGRNCQPTNETYNAIAVLCEVGMGQEAFTIIDSLYTRQKFDSKRGFYRYVLKVLRKQRNAYASFQFLHEMTERGFTPDSWMYSSLLTGLCSENMIGVWLQVSEMMEEEGFKVTAKDYRPFLYVLCTSGKTDMSLEFFCMMIEKGCMPSESTYRIIVQGLVLEKETELAALILKEVYSRQLIGKKAVDRLVLQFDLKDLCSGGIGRRDKI